MMFLTERLFLLFCSVLAATIDDISVFVIPLLPFKEEIRDRQGFLVNSTEEMDRNSTNGSSLVHENGSREVNGNPVENGLANDNRENDKTSDKQNNNSAVNGNESQGAQQGASSSPLERKPSQKRQ